MYIKLICILILRMSLSVIGPVLIGTKAVSVIGTELIIRTINGTTTSIYNTLKSITVSSEPNVKEYVDKISSIDLKFTISVMHELIKEQQAEKELPESIKMSLIGVNDILLEIDSELMAIYDAIKNHKNKYFSSWRTFSCKYNIEQIVYLNDTLNNRYSMLFNLLKIYNKKIINN